MISQDVTIPVNGLQMPAYLARPEEGSGAHPAVIVLQEIFGINAEMRRITELVAGAGYVGLAINFYHRTHPGLDVGYDEDGMNVGREAAGNVSRATLLPDLQASMDWLNAQPFVKNGQIATWGFCMGGAVAFLSATLPGISGAICFYGGSIARPFMSGDPEALADIDRISAPLLLCFGEKDQGIPREAIDRITSELRSHGKTFKCQTYPGVGHAFFRHGSPRAVSEHHQYSDEAIAQAVADSWDLVKSFLRENLSRTQPSASASDDTRTARTQPAPQ